MQTTQDATASNPVTKNPPVAIITRAEIIRRLREMGATSAGRLTFNEREAVLAAIYRLEIAP